MDIFEITTLKTPITTTVEIPGSKSYTNRALVLAALTKGPVTLCNPLFSEDTEAMIACLKTLGLHIEVGPDRIVVHDDISIVQNRTYDLYVKDSGTTIRFLLALLCLIPGVKVIKGNTRLNERPINNLVEALRLLGANIDFLEQNGQPPLRILSSSLNTKSEVKIDASLSSQFFSALLMISPYLNGLKIALQGELISKPYASMTSLMMREWGVEVLQLKNDVYYIPGGQHYHKSEYAIEGDFSSAGYFFAIAALTKSTITLKNLNSRSAQADQKFLNFLEKMGNEVHSSDDAITIVGKQILPLTLDMEDCPDQVQTMAVLAAFAKGTTTISGVRSLRLKETERVHALKNELVKMGIRTDDTNDTLTIYGGNPQPALIDTYGDHRMAMAFAVAGTKLPGMKIRNPEVVNKTFPSFWRELKKISQTYP
jgi:3-phosphoshikimate 1-carboxyvinyltransferase